MKKINILLLLLLCAACAFAQKVSVTAQAPPQVVEGRNFTVNVMVNNGSPESAPAAPQIAKCKHIYGPVKNMMQSYENINGRVSSSTQITFTYTYKAEKAGTTTVPAMSVIVDGKSYSTDQLKVEVLPPDQSNAGAQGGKRSAAPSVDDEVQFDPNDMFIRVILDKTTVYEQQAVTATVKIYSKYDITSFRSIAQPTFNDFFSEEIPLQSNGRTEHYNGKNYFTAELRKIVLYPQKSGRLEITSGQFELTVVLQQPVRVGPWIDYRPIEKPVTAKTNSATVTVLPLPAPRPANFSGAVGKYAASAELSPLSLRANELATYTYKIEGTGNVKFLTAPKLTIPAGIDNLTPKTQIDARFAGNDMTGTFTVNYSLVPQNPGKVTIPSQAFVYFDPSDKEYHTIDLPAFEMQVAKAAPGQASVEQTILPDEMTDIRHIKPTGDLSRGVDYAYRTPIYWGLYLICLLSFVAFIIAYRRQLKLRADVAGRKRAKANKAAARRMSAARQYMVKHDAEKFYVELNQAMTGYLSDKLGIPASRLVRENIAAELAAAGVEDSTIEQALAVLDDCEMARFTSSGSEIEMSQLLERARKAIAAIDKTKNTKNVINS